MTRLVLDRMDEMVEWVRVRAGDHPVSDPQASIGIESSAGELLAVVLYHGFRQYDIEATIVSATPRWATPGNIRAILDYPFNQLGVKRMTAITAKSNKKARKLLEGVGFCLEGVHPYVFGGERPACSYGIYSKTVQDKWFSCKV